MPAWFKAREEGRSLAVTVGEARWIGNLAIGSSKNDGKLKTRLSLLTPLVFLAVQVAILAILVAGLMTADMLRAFVASEGQYSKAQKAAVHSLGEYVRTGNPGDWSAYNWQIKIPRGARLGRLALEQDPPDLEAAERGFLQGFNHPDDVPGLIWMLRHFSDAWLLRDPIQLWRYGDENIVEIEKRAQLIKAEMDGDRDPETLNSLLDEVDHLDAELTVYEHAFSAAIRRSGAEVLSLVYWGGGSASLLLWAGALAFWYGNARQAQRARTELQLSERRFRDVAETAGDWIWETDDRFRVTYLSERIEQVVGVPKEKFLGLKRTEVARADLDDPKWRAHLADLEAHRSFRSFEFTYEPGDGRCLLFRASGRPVYDDKGKFRGYRGTGRDVTREVEAHRRIEEQHRILKATLEHMNQGISVFDGDLKLVAYNQRVIELLGLPEGLFQTGDSFEKIVRYNAERGEYGEGAVHELVRERVELAKRFEPHTLKRTRPDGRVILIEGSPMPGGGLVSVFTDITAQEEGKRDLRRALASAEQASQAKSHFLANMSHELRTPLNAIIGFSDLMRQEVLGPLGTDAYRDYLDDIKASGAHLLALIADILDLSRIEAGHFELTEERASLSVVIEDALRLVSSEADAAGVKVVCDLSPEVPAILGDSKRLLQVVVNLVGNAVKFSSEGDEVTVRTRRLGDGTIELEVEDRGPGIDAKDLLTILEPFRQAEATVARKQPGTGLGLPLVKRLVELHGGEFVMHSTLGEGTRAVVSLPARISVETRELPATASV